MKATDAGKTAPPPALWHLDEVSHVWTQGVDEAWHDARPVSEVLWEAEQAGACAKIETPTLSFPTPGAAPWKPARDGSPPS